MRQRSVTPARTMREQSEVSDSDVRYAYSLYEIIYRVMGLWPFTCQNIGSWGLTIFACTTQITMILFMTGETIISASQVDPQLMSFLSCNFLSLTKIIVVRANWSKMQLVIKDLISATNFLHDSKALAIVRARAKLGRTICIYQLGGTYFVCLPTIIATLPIFATIVNETVNDTSSGLRSFPLQTSRLFGGLSTSLYVIMFGYQIIQLFFTCTGNVGNDVCFFGIALNLTAQFECLALNCESISEPDTDVSRENIFSGTIKRQVELIELAKHLERTFNLIILCIVSANCSQICFYGILIIRSARAGDLVVCINTIICVIILTLQMFMYSYAGDSLSRAIENVGTTAYKCLWYEMSPANKQNVLFILLQEHHQSHWLVLLRHAGYVQRIKYFTFSKIHIVMCR
ncbi:uncharacterized protein [Fopius arisanus]|uniref:Odorant receptor n=1 Tax=Fopius arisanus TaxID=64838 RepID=A0A9R1TWE1_9HYME|nr:PREDICTED: uncharacterized protein LOC105263969 isoform X2 [Fopius arisanus]